VVGGSSPLAHPKLKAGHAPVAQWTERRTSDPLVAGSNPAGRASQYNNRISTCCGPLAQLAEHLTLNQGVTGSIPVRSTIFFPARVVEPVDTLDLGSSGESLAGSSPASRTREVPSRERLVQTAPGVLSKRTHRLPRGSGGFFYSVLRTPNHVVYSSRLILTLNEWNLKGVVAVENRDHFTGGQQTANPGDD
jgi:hypothetical protein